MGEGFTERHEVDDAVWLVVVRSQGRFYTRALVGHALHGDYQACQLPAAQVGKQLHDIVLEQGAGVRRIVLNRINSGEVSSERIHPSGAVQAQGPIIPRVDINQGDVGLECQLRMIEKRSHVRHQCALFARQVLPMGDERIDGFV